MVARYKFLNDCKFNIFSLAAFLFFLAYLRMYLVGNTFDGYFLYAISIFSAAYGFFYLGFKWDLTMFSLIVLILITGLLNAFFIGNTTVTKLLYTVLGFGIAVTLKNKSVSRATFLFSYYVFFVLIAYRMFTLGIQHVFALSSENFVSVVLMMPLFLFYSQFDSKYERVPIIPAVLYAIICLLAAGRTGIGVSILLVMGIAAYNFFYVGDKSKLSKSLMFISLAVLVFVMAFYVLENMDSLSNRFSFLEHFRRSGFSNKARSIIWRNYFTEATQNLKSLLFGVDYSNNMILAKYNGNTHNSFLSIHEYNGIVMFVAFIVLSIKTLINEFKEKHYMFALAFFLFIFRSFFDSVFWNNYGTVFFLWFVLTPYIFKKEKC